MFRAFQLPCLLSVPLHTIMGEFWWCEGPDHGEVPSGSHHFHQVLLGAQVVVGDLPVGLEGGLAGHDELDVVDEEDAGEEEGGEVDTPEEDGDLAPGDVHPGDEDHEGKDELEGGEGGEQAEFNPQIEGVEVATVEDASPQPGKEHDEVSVVGVSYAVPSKHAVMFPLEDADPTRSAVPGSRGSHGFTCGAEMPFVPDLWGGNDDEPGWGVHEPKPEEVSSNVNGDESTEEHVDKPGDGGLGVDLGHDDSNLPDIGEGNHADHEEEGPYVGDLLRDQLGFPQARHFRRF